MPEIEIDSDTETGELETTINGITGILWKKTPWLSRKSLGNLSKMKKRTIITLSRTLSDK